MNARTFVFIDSHHKRIIGVECHGPSLKFLQMLVGGNIEKVTITETDDLWVNEEALHMNLKSGFVYHSPNGRRITLCGNGVVSGFNPESGNTTSTTMGLEEIQDLIEFIDITEELI